MSFQVKIDPKRRVAGRFIGHVRDRLLSAAIEEKKSHGLTQTQVAQRLDVDKSVVSRWLNGSENLTLRSVAEIAYALNREIIFDLVSPAGAPDSNSKTNHFDSRQRVSTKPSDEAAELAQHLPSSYSSRSF